jgi:hypothetical protein
VTTAAHDDEHDEEYDHHDAVTVVALHDLRSTRKRRRVGDWNVIDALYRAYASAVIGALAATMLSGVVGDDRLGRHQLHDIRNVGPAVIGTAVALAIAVGLRSGARGGPIALEAAEVRHVLLAPVDRDVALAEPARRQLRHGTFIGLVAGAAVGLLAFRRLPGHPVSWVVSGAAVGAAAGAAMTGAAMCASGRRLGRTTAPVIGAVLIAWSVFDVATGRMTSPASMLGQLALWPIDVRPVAVLGLLPVLALGVVGLRVIGGLSLEHAERRGRLISHLRFAATFQDLRTVMLLRRQLAAEQPRSRPWIRLRPAPTSRRRTVTWRRDWRGILRWPGSRLLRLAGLGLVAGLSTAAAWAGTTPMILVAGGAMYIAALDAIEGLAQEIDHPDRRDSFPAPSGALHLRHLAAPTVVLTIVGLIGVIAAAAVSGDPTTAFQVGGPLVLPAGALAAGAAAVSSLRQPPDPNRLMLDSTGSMLLFHHGLPPALAMLGPAATLLVHSGLHRDPTANPASVALSAAFNIALVAGLVFGWVRHREAIATSMAGGGAQRAAG